MSDNTSIINNNNKNNNKNNIGGGWRRVPESRNNKKARLTPGLRATAPSFQDGRQLQSWILLNR